MRDKRLIFDRTDGRCHLCGKRLCFSNYGKFGDKGAWEIEHSRPQALGGSDHGNNLYPACIRCNRQKQAQSTRRVRAALGRTKAPLSKVQRKSVSLQRRIAGVGIGAFTGFRIAGPPGVLVGSLVGFAVGHKWKVTS